VIAELDVRRRQVFVEAIILEVTTDKLRALGVDFQGVGTAGSTVGIGQLNLGVLGTAATDPTSLPGLLLAAASSRTVTLPSGERVPAYSLLLTALQRERDVNVLSAPNVVTTDNEEAEIVVGRNVPFVASRATNGTNLANLFTTVERHDVGITLRMTPQITADDFVRLALFEEVSDIDPTASAGDPTLVITISAPCRMMQSRSSCRVSRRMIRLGQNGASCGPRALRIWLSHSSSIAEVRQFATGNAPMTPALQAAITSSGPDTLNIGAAITGNFSRDAIKGSSTACSPCGAAIFRLQ